MNSLNSPFYLTGGTALSRGYFHHRFSNDLDYFANGIEQFSSWLAEITKALENHCKDNKIQFPKDKVVIGEHYARFYIEKNDIPLNIDFVNDIESHFGSFKMHPELGKIDSVRNILSNKLTALFRYEPKDVADIWIIAKNISFHWENVFKEAKEKELGLDILIIAEILQTFPKQQLEYIKWSKDYDFNAIASDIQTIANDILKKSLNSLNISKK